MRKKKDEELDLLNSFALLTQIGLTLGIPIIIGVVMGRMIDVSIGDSHLFLFIFLIIGIIVGFYGAYRELKRINVNKKTGSRNKK